MSIPIVDTSVEKVVTLYEPSWEQFKGIEAQLKDNRSVRLSYLSGLLEIMSPVGILDTLTNTTMLLRNLCKLFLNN